MDNTVRDIIDEMIEEQCGEAGSFIIDTDERATWALEKIAIERAESQRYINVCESMILSYKEKMEKEKEKLISKTSYLEGQLQTYFNSVDKKATKTQATYKLPSGTLKMKFKKKIEKDDEKLKEFLDMSYVDGPDYLECVETVKVKWAEFKKTLNFVDGQAVTCDGEVLDFITETTENEFVVEV
jgi:hypothetical protein